MPHFGAVLEVLSVYETHKTKNKRFLYQAVKIRNLLIKKTKKALKKHYCEIRTSTLKK